MLCFRKFPLAKKFMVNRGVGASRFSVETCFLSHSAENFPRAASLSVSLNWGTEKNWLRVGGFKIFRRNFFSSHRAENFPRGASLSVSITWGNGKIWLRRGVSRLAVEF